MTVALEHPSLHSRRDARLAGMTRNHANSFLTRCAPPRAVTSNARETLPDFCFRTVFHVFHPVGFGRSLCALTVDPVGRLRLRYLRARFHVLALRCLRARFHALPLRCFRACQHLPPRWHFYPPAPIGRLHSRHPEPRKKPFNGRSLPQGARIRAQAAVGDLPPQGLAQGHARAPTDRRYR